MADVHPQRAAAGPPPGDSPSPTLPGGLLRRDAPALVGLAFFAVTALVVLLVPLSDREGMLTMVAAEGAMREPVAMLLSQKFRPAGTLLSLPGAALGWTAFQLWHALLAALAVVFLGRVAARLGGSALACALVLATSPSFFVSAVSGQSNSDAIFVLSAALLLWTVHGRPLAAGLLLGALPWVRYEYLPFAFLIAGASLIRPPDRRVFLGMCAFPLALLLAGLAYHRDLLWWFHYPPTLLGSTPGTHIFEAMRRDGYYFATLPPILLQVTPAWMLPALVRWSALDFLGRLALVVLGVTFAAMVGIPFIQVLNFEHSPRYLMAILPFVALAVALLVRTGPNAAPDKLLLGFAALGAWLAWHGRDPSVWIPCALLAAPLVYALLYRRRGPRVAVVVPAVLLAVGLATFVAPPLRDLNRLDGVIPERGLEEVVAWLERSPEAAGAERILTNDMRLDKHLRARDPALADRLRLLFHYDVVFELHSLHHAEVGQTAAVVAALRRSLYGHALFPCEVAATPSFEGALLVVHDDLRFAETYSAGFLDAVGTELVAFGRTRVLAGRPPPPGGYASLPPTDEPWRRLGCPSSKPSSAATSRDTSPPAAATARTGR